MANHGRNHPAQSFDEMLETGLEKKKSSGLYKAQSLELTDERLSGLIAKTAQELAETTTKDPVSLSDVQQVRERTILYLKACELSSSFPSVAGLARSMGLSRQSLYDCIWRKSPPKTAAWLEMFRDSCSDVLAESSLRNNCNLVVSIFLQKALYNLRETVEVVAKQDVSPLGETVDPEELRRRIEANVVIDDWEDE